MAETSPKVLVVDDERFFREAVQEILGQAGIECESAASGAEAVEAARNPQVGVVVLDVTLEDMSGIEVLRRIREERPALRVVMLSASADQDLVLEALRADASDYLAKPLHDEELVLSVRRALGGFELESSRQRLRERIARVDALLGRLYAEADRAAQLGPEAGIESFADALVNAASDLLDASKLSLLVLDEEANELRVVAATGSPLAATEMDPVALGEGVAGVALSLGEAVLVDDVYSDSRFAGQARGGEQYETASLAVVPLRDGERPLGVICATDRIGGIPFGPDELVLLALLARPMARFLARVAKPELELDEELEPGEPMAEPGGEDPENAAHAADSAEAERGARLLRELCAVITTEVEPRRLLDAALARMAELLPAELASLYLIDNISGDLLLEGVGSTAGIAERERLDRRGGLTASVLQSGAPVASAEPDRAEGYSPLQDSARDGVVRPLVCIPLRMRGKVLGLARFFGTAPLDEMLRLAELAEPALSAAVRNVLLYRSLLETIDEVADARRERGGAY